MARRRIKIIWTPRAEKNLEQIHDYIAKDSPRRAGAFAKRIKEAVRRLQDFPEFGAVVEQLEEPDLRQFFVKSYRVIYRLSESTIEVLTVRHGAMLLNKRDILPE
jgi:toxin ParE1/3/4